jgi:hypothetical protein
MSYLQIKISVTDGSSSRQCGIQESSQRCYLLLSDINLLFMRFQINWSDIWWFEFSEINNIHCINQSRVSDKINATLVHTFIVTTPEYKISESETSMDVLLWHTAPNWNKWAKILILGSFRHLHNAKFALSIAETFKTLITKFVSFKEAENLFS